MQRDRPRLRTDPRGRKPPGGSLDGPSLDSADRSVGEAERASRSPPRSLCRSCRAGPFDLGEAMTVYIFDLRGLDKPTHTTPAKTGGLPRPHYSTNAEQRRRRAAAREAGGIDRIAAPVAARLSAGAGGRPRALVPPAEPPACHSTGHPVASAAPRTTSASGHAGAPRRRAGLAAARAYLPRGNRERAEHRRRRDGPLRARRGGGRPPRPAWRAGVGAGTAAGMVRATTRTPTLTRSARRRCHPPPARTVGAWTAPAGPQRPACPPPTHSQSDRKPADPGCTRSAMASPRQCARMAARRA